MKKAFLAGALAAALVASLAGGAWAADPPRVTVDRVVAVVDDQIILLSELAAASAPYEERAAQEAPDPMGRALARKQVREKILNDMIAEKLVEEQAKELNLTVSDREVDQEIARIKKENNLDDAQFAAQMRAEGVDANGVRDMLRKQKLRQKVVEVRVYPRVSISDSEIRAYYDENYKNDDEVTLSMISKRVPQATSEAEMKRLRDRMDEIRAEVTTGGRDFAAVAKKETEGPNPEGGGQIGTFKRGEIAPEIERAAFALKEGDVSQVIEYGGALHILRVDKRTSAPAKPFEQVQDKIRGLLFSQAAQKEYDRWIQEVRAKSFVEVRLDGPVVAEETFATPTPTPATKPAPKK